MQSLPIGTTVTYNQEFHIPPEDRQKHMDLFGKSGVGKSTLLRNMIAADIHAGLGVTVLDPHGALIEHLLTTIPRDRTKD